VKEGEVTGTLDDAKQGNIVCRNTSCVPVPQGSLYRYYWGVWGTGKKAYHKKRYVDAELQCRTNCISGNELISSSLEALHKENDSY
jgi:hypothetical protein